jgi:outer membrane immunogenic protein
VWRCVSVLFLAVSTVFAAPANAQIPQRWNGPYIGVNLGYGSADIGGSLSLLNKSGSAVHGPVDYGIDADGMFGGVQAGFNRRLGNFFVGLEADLQTADLSGSSKITVSGFSYDASAAVDWFVTARVRGGFATEAMLIYATGGIAFAGADYDATFKAGNKSAHLSDDATQTGFVLGAGVEVALSSNWSLKFEYQYLNFGDQSAQGAYSWTTKSIVNCVPITTTHTNTVNASFDTDIHTLRVGLNYAFHAEPPHRPLKP